MTNKIYEKTKKILNKIFNGTTITIINIILISLILISLFVELPYGVYMPGGATSVITHLSNIKYKASGDIATTHVSYIGGEIFSLIAAIFIPNWDIVPVSDMKYTHEEIEDADKRMKIDLYSSASVATVLAYERAGVPLEITSEEYYVTYLFEEAKSELKIGDKVLKYNNLEYNGPEMSEYISSLEYSDEIKLTVLRDGKEVETTSKVVEIEGGKYIGVVITTIKKFNEEEYVTFKPEDNASGSSGGLMMSLGIYNSITENDITDGRKICGTGTIDYDGTVGEISGVKYKVMGSVKDKCDIFLVPEANYQEAKDTKEKFDYKIEIKSVSNFDEALNFLTK